MESSVSDRVRGSAVHWHEDRRETRLRLVIKMLLIVRLMVWTHLVPVGINRGDLFCNYKVSDSIRIDVTLSSTKGDS